MKLPNWAPVMDVVSPLSYRVIWVKRRVVSVSAISVGSRSIELAP